jgi:acetyltransferase
MQMLIAYARKRNLQCIQGQVLHDNATMLNMCEELGFEIHTNPDEPYVCDVRLAL